MQTRYCKDTHFLPCHFNAYSIRNLHQVLKNFVFFVFRHCFYVSILVYLKTFSATVVNIWLYLHLADVLYPKQENLAWKKFPSEQPEVQCLAQGHIGISPVHGSFLGFEPRVTTSPYLLQPHFQFLPTQFQIQPRVQVFVLSCFFLYFNLLTHAHKNVLARSNISFYIKRVFFALKYTLQLIKLKSDIYNATKHFY